MKKAAQYLWAMTGILPVAIISSIIIGVELREERCYGLVDAFVFVLLNGGLLITLVICIIIQLARLTKKKDVEIKITNLAVMMLLAGAAFWLSNIEDDSFQEPPILKAEMTKSLSIGKITLREKNTFTAHYGHVDWSCVRVGKYEIMHDTLVLGDRISNESDRIIASKYLIQGNEYLVPIDSDIQNSTLWMKITEIGKENWR